MNRPRLRIAFLDVNGTVVDDWQAAYGAVCAVFEHYAKAVPTLDAYAHMVGNSGDYHEFYRAHGIDETRDELYKTWLPGYLALKHTVRVVEGLDQLVAALTAAEVEIHVLSAARRDAISWLVEMAGLARVCEAHHYHVHDKTAQVQAIVHRSPFDPRECLMVGDMPSDLQTCKDAGIGGILMHLPQTPSLLLDRADAIGHIGSAANFHDVLKIVNKHFAF